MPQSLDRLHIILIIEIIIHLSQCIEFNFDSALNTIEFSISVNFFIFSYVQKMKASVNGER